MRKIFILVTVLILGISSLPANAMSFGLYKPEEEYGLIDGFKFNFFNRDRGKKLIEIKSDMPEEKERLRREKEKPPVENDDYQLFRFIREGTVAI